MALDFETKMKDAAISDEDANSYELPDGNIVSFHTERFRCPEVLFQPSLVGKEAMGIHEATFQTIAKCDFDGIFASSALTLTCTCSIFFNG